MSLTILLITDETTETASLCQLLTSAGHAAIPVPEGEDPLRAVRRVKADLVILAVREEKVAALAAEKRLPTPYGSRIIPQIVLCRSTALERELPHIFDMIPLPLDEARLLNAVSAIASKPATAECHPVLTPSLFHDFSSHILSCTGLEFGSRNRSTLVRAVNRRMAALCMESYPEYLSFLRRHGHDRFELDKLLHFLTVGETYFFRYPAQFSALKEYAATMAPFPKAPIRIWSAGCSTGEEPYSIAITIMEALPDWRDRDIKIIATDINHGSIARAREAV